MQANTQKDVWKVTLKTREARGLKQRDHQTRYDDGFKLDPSSEEQEIDGLQRREYQISSRGNRYPLQ